MRKSIVLLLSAVLAGPAFAQNKAPERKVVEEKKKPARAQAREQRHEQREAAREARRNRNKSTHPK